MEKIEPLSELKEKATSITIKEFTKDGALMQFNSAGEVKGRYHAVHIETDDVKMNIDGTSEWEARAMETTKEGDVILMTGRGTGKQEKAMQSSIKGEVTYMTNSPRLSWLNNLKGYVEGVLDQKNGEASSKVYLAKPEVTPQVAAPIM